MFEVGDKIRVVSPFCGTISLVGKTGTIRKITRGTQNGIGVEFDSNSGYTGHNLDDRSLSNRCRWGAESEIELIGKRKPMSKTAKNKALQSFLKEVLSSSSGAIKKDITNYQKAIKGNEANVVAYKAAIISYEADIVRHTETIKDKEAQLIKAEAAVTPQMIKEGEQSFAQISKHKKVTGLIMDESYIRVTTKPLKIGDVKIGRFEIAFQSTGPVQLNNLDYKYNYYDHPHIENGRPCFGNYESSIYKYREQGQLFLFVDSLIRFIEDSYYGDGSYVRLESWNDNKVKLR